jgi:hypothetical protein
MVCPSERVPCTRGRAARMRPGRVLVLGLVLCGLAGLLPLAQSQEPAALATEGTPHPLDQPLTWLNEAKRNFGAVRDYSCTLVSRESVRGVLGDENIIAFKARTQPFSVAMRWIAPTRLRNQEVCFVLGQNSNKMRVKQVGLGKVVGFVSVDPNDYRVMEQSRHNIYEAGIGSLIETTLGHWELERKLNKTQLRVADYNYNNRVCSRIETIRTERRPEFYCYRSVLFIDKESKLPVRTENYDWPRPGGDAEGDLVELFSYVDLQFNVGLPDRDFTR